MIVLLILNTTNMLFLKNNSIYKIEINLNLAILFLLNKFSVAHLHAILLTNIYNCLLETYNKSVINYTFTYPIDIM